MKFPGKPLFSVLAAAMLAAPIVQATPAEAQANKPATQSAPAAPSAPPAASAVTIPKFNGPGGLGTADTVWMQQKAHGAIFDIEASKLAAQKAQSPKVRAFAQTVVDDDMHAGETLGNIARKNEVLLPEHPDQAQQKELDHLRSLNGAAFDAAYLKAMRTATQHDMGAEQAEAHTVRDRALLDFVKQQQKQDQKQAHMAVQLQEAQATNHKQ
jgi:putative membrane protein